MKIQLSEHFTYSKLVRFTAPSILMMIFTSVYWIVDGLFIANFAGVTSFAAINLVWPFVMIFNAIGFMLGAGGSALIAKTLGEGDKIRANRLFSMLVYATAIIGVVISIASLLALKPLLEIFGVDKDLLSEGLRYGGILMPALSLSMLQCVFQSLFITAERPKLNFAVTFLVGMNNIVLDALFISYFGMGVRGAAIATTISWGLGAVIPMLYFTCPNGTALRIGKFYFDMLAMLKICTNGMSEFVSMISQSLVCALYNYQMLRFAGENGVAAYGVISYLSFIFIAVFLGYSFGVAPVISYHYGARNKIELASVFRKSLVLIGSTGLVLTLFAEIFARLLSMIFISDNNELLNITVSGFHIYAISFLLSGFSIYASSFYTALNNGVISAIISCCRTLLFECSCVIILPLLFGLYGIWSAIIVAEAMALAISIVFFAKLRTKYGY